MQNGWPINILRLWSIFLLIVISFACAWHISHTEFSGYDDAKALFEETFPEIARFEGCGSSRLSTYFDALRSEWEALEKTETSESPSFEPWFLRIIKVEEPVAFKSIYDLRPGDLRLLKIEDKYLSVNSDDLAAFEKNFTRFEKRISKIDPASLHMIGEEKDKSRHIILFSHGFYEDETTGYYVKLTQDGGKTWKKYYTGLAENYPYYIKINPDRSFWANETTLQFEATSIRIDESTRTHPQSDTLSYEITQDSLLILLSLEALSLDTDGDGLTDIIEEKFNTDPATADTDGDGVPDAVDCNPRYAPGENDTIHIYEAILTGLSGPSSFCFRLSDYLADKASKSSDYDITTNVHPMIIITDDPNLPRVHAPGSQLLLMTTKEYEEYYRNQPSPLQIYGLTPMFRCDDFADIWIVVYSGGFYGGNYLIRRVGDDWVIAAGGDWIS
jgi:hypothetical protein